jgi:hypothetical protein
MMVCDVLFCYLQDTFLSYCDPLECSVPLTMYFSEMVVHSFSANFTQYINVHTHIQTPFSLILKNYS